MRTPVVTKRSAGLRRVAVSAQLPDAGFRNQIMQTDTTEKSAAKRLPLLPLRDVVVFPHMVIPLFVGRERSIKALDRPWRPASEIMLVAQTQPTRTTRARRTCTRSARSRRSCRC